MANNLTIQQLTFANARIEGKSSLDAAKEASPNSTEESLRVMASKWDRAPEIQGYIAKQLGKPIISRDDLDLVFKCLTRRILATSGTVSNGEVGALRLMSEYMGALKPASPDVAKGPVIDPGIIEALSASILAAKEPELQDSELDG